MAAFHDCTAAQRTLHAETVPTLEAFESNPALLERSRRRFERDSPPPYTSSTEGESEPEADHVGQQDIQELLDALLSEQELDEVGMNAIIHYEAGFQLFDEYMAEYDHLEWFSTVYLIKPELTRFLKYHATKQRLHILARAGVRRRWQTLGIWNKNWGTIQCKKKTMNADKDIIKDEKGQPWRWEWQAKAAPHDKTHPAWRAASLRAGLRRGECPVPSPRESINSSSSTGEKEAFITSRPWFQFTLSLLEESARWSRLTMAQQQRADLTESSFDVVKRRWQKKGLWKNEWDRHRPKGEPGWKWRHESASPEPEQYVRSDGADILQELSPSELDEYESIEPVAPSTPPSELWPGWKEEAGEAPKKTQHKDTNKASKTRRAKKNSPLVKTQQSKVQKPAKKAATTASEPRRSSRIAALKANKEQEMASQEKEERRKQEPVKTAPRARDKVATKKSTAKKSKASGKVTKPKRK